MLHCITFMQCETLDPYNQIFMNLQRYCTIHQKMKLRSSPVVQFKQYIARYVSCGLLTKENKLMVSNRQDQRKSSLDYGGNAETSSLRERR